jgi:hypothetical protein
VGTIEFKLKLACLRYGHAVQHTAGIPLKLNVTSQDGGPGAHVAVELDAASARKLLEAIQEVIRQAEAGGFVEG